MLLCFLKKKKLVYLVCLAVREKLLIKQFMNLTGNTLNSILRFEKTVFIINRIPRFKRLSKH